MTSGNKALRDSNRSNQVFRNINDPEFHFSTCVFEYEIDKSFDFAYVTQKCELVKIREGDQVLAISSPHQGDGFEMFSVRDNNGRDLEPRKDSTTDRFSRYEFTIKEQMTVGDQQGFEARYKEKLNSTLVRTFFLGKQYNLIFKKTLGTSCGQLKFVVNFPDRWTNIDHMYPASNYVSHNELIRQNLHAGDPSVLVLDVRRSIFSAKTARYIWHIAIYIVGLLTTIAVERLFL